MVATSAEVEEQWLFRVSIYQTSEKPVGNRRKGKP